VLQILRRHGPLSTPELAARMATSRPTLDAVLRSLAEQGWVREQPGPARAAGQAPAARVYTFDATRHTVAALDLGSGTLRALVTDLTGHRLGDATLPVQPDDSLDQLVRKAGNVLSTACRAAAVSPADLAAVIGGTPGILVPDGSRVTTAEESHRGLEADMLPGGPTTLRVLANDANLAALAEIEHGAAAGFADLFYLLIGERMGTGLVLGGEIHQGAHGAAGEIGTLALFGWPEVHGELRALAARRDVGVDRMLDELMDDSRLPPLLDRLLESLAQGIAATVLVVDPQLVVVSGPATRGARFVDLLQQSLARQTPVPIDVRASPLDDEQVCLGGIRMALTAVDASLFRPRVMPSTSPLVLT